MNTAALDIGTTSVRASIYDAAGELLGFARRPLSKSYPFDGAVEQDPVEIVDSCVSMLGEAASAAGLVVADVVSLGITNQRATVVAWNAETGESLRPAIGWQDTRTSERVAELVAMGIPITTSASCTKFEWLVGNDDACIDARSRGVLRMGTIDSWVTSALSANSVAVTDPSNAGVTGLYEAGSLSRSELVLELFGLDAAWFVDIVGSAEMVGHTAADVVGGELELRSRLGDQSASYLAHRLEAGDAKLSVGTSAMFGMGVDSALAPAPTGGYVLPLASIDGVETYMAEASVQAAGASIEWLVAIGLLDRPEDLDIAAADGGSGVEFVSALAGLGSPWNEPDTRGLLAGLSLGTTRNDIVRAVTEGLAGRVAEVIATVGPTGSIVVDGGLSQSTVLMQLIADISGCELKVASDAETASRGAAMLSAPGGATGWQPIGTRAITPGEADSERDATRRDKLRQAATGLAEPLP